MRISFNTSRLLSMLLACLLSFSAGAVENPPTLAIGASAPDFDLAGVDGKNHKLADFAAAKVLVIVFTCNHCPTAQYYEERFKRFVTEYGPKGAALVAISPNSELGVRLDELGYTDLSDSFEEMKIRAKHKEFNFPYLYDGDKEDVSRAYGPKVTPHAFVFDAERKLRYVGRIDDSEREAYVQSKDLLNAVDALLAGKEPPVTVTKAGGCSTKWKGKEDQVKAYMAKAAAEPITIEMADEAAMKALRKNENETPKIRVVNFWSTTCGPCVAEMPELVTINRMYRNRPFELVLVSTNYPDEKEEALQVLKKKEASMRNLLFAERDKYKLMAAFDPDWDASQPYTVILNPKGEIIKRIEGAFEPLELKREIVKALTDLNGGDLKGAAKKK